MPYVSHIGGTQCISTSWHWVNGDMSTPVSVQIDPALFQPARLKFGKVQDLG